MPSYQKHGIGWLKDLSRPSCNEASKKPYRWLLTGESYQAKYGAIKRGTDARSRSSSYAIPDGMDFGLAHLDFMLGVDAMIPDDRRVCAVVLAELKQIYESVKYM